MNILVRISVIIGLLTAAGVLQAGPTVYVPLGSANQVVAIDAATDKITASYPGVDNPHGLVATPDGEYLVAGSLTETPLAAGQPSDTPNSKLFLVHPGHGHVMLSIPVAGWTHHLAIMPDGRYVLATHPTRGTVSVVDLQSNQVVKSIATGPAPNYAVVTPDGKRVFVTNSGNGTISEIDVTMWAVTRTLEGGPGPEHMVLSGDGKTLFVTNPKAGTVSVVSIETGKVTDTWQIGGNLHGLDIGDDGKTLFVTTRQDEKLSAFDTAKRTIARQVSLSPAPYHLNTVKGTGKVYVSSRKAAKIWVVDQTTLKVLGEIALPAGEGHQMAIVN